MKTETEFKKENKEDVIEACISFIEEMIIVFNQRFPELTITREEIISKLNERAKI